LNVNVSIGIVYMITLIYDVVLDPNFVSSFVYNDKVYFFFREMAIENINCGKVSTVHGYIMCTTKWTSSQLSLVHETVTEKNIKMN